MRQKNNFSFFIYVFFIFIFLSSLNACSCVGSTGNYGSAGSLYNYKSHDLFVDAMRLDQQFYTSAIWYYESTELEIHIMSEDEEDFLGCVGPGNHAILNYMVEGIQYGEMNAQFYVDGNTELDDGTKVTLRLIEKSNDHANCPAAYNTSTVDQHGYEADPDKIVTTLTMEYADLFGEDVDFNGYATVNFKTSADEDLEFEVDEDVEEGALAINQLYLQDMSFNDDESSRPEVAVYIARYGQFEMVACLELEDVESGSVLFAGLEEKFQDENADNITPDDLDAEEEYWILVTEMDDVRCPDPDSLSDGEYDLLASSDVVTVDDLISGPIYFNHDEGYVNFNLR